MWKPIISTSLILYSVENKLAGFEQKEIHEIHWNLSGNEEKFSVGAPSNKVAFNLNLILR